MILPLILSVYSGKGGYDKNLAKIQGKSLLLTNWLHCLVLSSCFLVQNAIK